ncbi:MAG: hypothetical protein M3209_09735 [Acidobacteriota bacterium]|nr:hypothetical protein [Acidobacteriota bacterium]
MTIAEKKEDIAAYITRMLGEKEISEGELARRAERKGFKLSQSYVNVIKNRQVLGESLTIKVLAAIAAGFEVPEWEVYAAARGIEFKTNTEMENASLYLREMPPETLKDAIVLLEALYRRHRQDLPIVEKQKSESAAKQTKEQKNRIVGKTASGNIIKEAPFIRSKSKTDKEETEKKK